MLPCYFVEGKELTPEEKAERENFTKNGFGIFSTINQDNITPLSKDLEI